MKKAMKMKLVLLWFGRKEDFSENTFDMHKSTIIGETPAELMRQYKQMSNDHDLAKYTPIRIVGIYDAEYISKKNIKSCKKGLATLQQ